VGINKEVSVMNTEKRILDAVQASAKEGKLTCTQARKLAEDLGVPPARVGEACNELKIKLKSCELGCFE
jgi:hypothetical protein